MSNHRLVPPSSITVKPFSPPFSSFEFVEQNYGNQASIRRLFSLGRSGGAHTLLVESIPETGFISEENEDIKHSVKDYKMSNLHRISFWKSEFNHPEAGIYTEDDCIGYAILKCDAAPSISYNSWHVFEAVFKKYPHEHNCVPNPMQFSVVLGGKKLSITGILYAQQNMLNKSCAQVALRSLISRVIQNDVSYRQINDYARTVPGSIFNPGKGLNIDRIRAVLNGFGIQYSDYEYPETMTLEERELVPYDKYVYSGVESGMGALLGFKFAGPAAQRSDKHIIPFYGHTFNKDTWAPEANKDYFHVGDQLGYLPSDNWTSSFLGHDDNFGPNFCVPRLFISSERVEYVVELLRSGIAYNGAQAQALALDYLYSALSQLGKPFITGNDWLKRLIFYYNDQRVVLRAVAMDRETYVKHLAHSKDFRQNSENPKIISILAKTLPQTLWVVEFSLPQLFPANESKLGEIILDGGLPITANQSYSSHFALVRFPGHYLFDLSTNAKKKSFLIAPSSFISHVPVIRL